MIITPAYNFGVNEVPTREKFQLMMAGMSLTAINVSQITSSIIGAVSGNTGASMPLEGWLRIDPYGSLWVSTATGASNPSSQVRVERNNWGGWETRRIPALSKVDTWPIGVGGTNYAMSARATLQWLTTNNTLESNLGLLGSVGALTQQIAFKFLESGVSGYPVRVLGRGGCEAIGTVFNSHPAYINCNQTGGATNFGYVVFPFSSIAANQGLAVKNHLGTGRLLHWMFGAYMAGQ